MSFTEPPELLTAVTDAAIIPFAAAFAIIVGRISDRGYMRLWRTMLVSGAGGLVAHGVVMSDETKNLVWIPLQIAMLATVILFLCIAVWDLAGGKPCRVFLISAFAAFAVMSALTAALMLTGTDSFDIFLVTASLCVGSGFVIYPILIYRRKRYAILMLTGIGIQAIGILPRLLGLQSVIAIGDFDGNSIYHTAAIISLFVFCTGVLKRDKETA